MLIRFKGLTNATVMRINEAAWKTKEHLTGMHTDSDEQCPICFPTVADNIVGAVALERIKSGESL